MVRRFRMGTSTGDGHQVGPQVRGAAFYPEFAAQVFAVKVNRGFRYGRDFGDLFAAAAVFDQGGHL
jgi:hypothetical protein